MSDIHRPLDIERQQVSQNNQNVGLKSHEARTNLKS